MITIMANGSRRNKDGDAALGPLHAATAVCSSSMMIVTDWRRSRSKSYSTAMQCNTQRVKKKKSVTLMWTSFVPPTFLQIPNN